MVSKNPWPQKRFELTEDHVKLLRRANVRWEDEPYEGAPAIDAKRPFGNSDWVSDVAEIIGLEPIETDDGETFWPKGTRERCETLYRTLADALQVVLASGSFEPGIYISDRYHDNWRKETG